MREKYVKLIVTLQKEGGFITGSELAQKLHVSDRTIRSYIKDLNENYLVDAMIKNNKSKGYILTGEVSEIKRSHQVEFEERAFFISKYLMEKEGWSTYEEIAEALLFSSQTIRNDVLKIQQLMNDQLRNIKVESVIFQGIRLIGSEIDKRLFLDSLSNPPTLTNLNFTKSLSYYFKNWTTTEELDKYVLSVEENMTKLNIPTSKENLLPIISYLVISLKRINDKQIITDASHLLDKYDITHTKEYSVSKRILLAIAAEKNLSIPEGEIIYLSFYLMSQRLLFSATEENAPHISESVKQNVLDTLMQLEKEYQMSFSNDSQLSSGLILHLSRDIYPLLFNFYIENSFITTIKQEYIHAYYIAVSFAHMISQKLGINIPENEIGYLALHFASYIERKKKAMIRTVIVSGRNKPASLLLKRELEQKIPNLQIEEIIEFNKLPSLSNEIQCIISPLELTKETTIPAIQVSELATREELDHIESFITRLLSKKLLQIDNFSRYLANYKETVLKNMIDELNLTYLYESLIEREKLSTTEVGHGVAIPHPLATSHLSQTKISAAVLEKPVVWGSDKVNLVFLIIPGKEKQSEMSQLMDELHRIVNNTELLKKLIDSQSKKAFQAIINS